MQSNQNLNLGEIVTLSMEAYKSENFGLQQHYLNLLEAKKIIKIQEAQSAAAKGDVDKVDEIILEIKNAQSTFSKNNIEIEDNIKNLFEMYNKNMFRRAIEMSKRLLLNYSENPLIYNVYGLSLIQISEFKEAETIFKKGLNSFPNDFNLNNNISIVFTRLKDLKSAQKFLEKALRLNPNSSETLSNLGNIFFANKNYSEAINIYEQSLITDPSNTKALMNLSLCYKELHDLDEAYKKAEMAIKQDPANSEFQNCMGLIFKDYNDINKAILFFKRALSLDPMNVEAMTNVADAYRNTNNFSKALDHYQRAIEIDPKFCKAYKNFSTTLRAIGKLDEAEKVIDFALNQMPDEDDVYRIKAVILIDRGLFEEARNYLEKCLVKNELNSEAYRLLSRIKKFQKNDTHLNKMKKIIKDVSLSKNDQSHIYFAMGKAYEDLGKYKDAFKNFKSGNDVVCSQLNISLKNHMSLSARKLFENIKKHSLKNNLDTKIHYENNKVRPIFVLGMPRSGTSLVENIISSHSLVKACGELSYIRDYSYEFLEEFSDNENSLKNDLINIKQMNSKDYKDFGNSYLEYIKRFSQNKSIITDKMPHNFLWISLIKNALPFAKVIYLERNPLDVCLSLYKNLFSEKEAHFYSFDLRTLGHYYNLHKDLMEHWDNIYPGFIYRCKYEKIVFNPEIEIKKLIRFCDLTWEDNILKFNNQKNIISTASNFQARQKIYKSSVDIWKNYKLDLKPLLEIIN